MELDWLETVRLIGLDILALAIAVLFGLDFAVPRLQRWWQRRRNLLPQNNKSPTTEERRELSYPPPQWLDRSAGQAAKRNAASPGTSQSPHPGTRHAA